MGDLALLRKAEVLEADRASFYKHSASKVLNPTGKAALLRLADAERRHLKIINSQRVSINNSGDADLSGLETPVFEDLKKDFDSSVKANQGDIDILEKAVKLERVDFPFYEGLYKQAKSPGVKKLFKVLEKEERKHFGLISKSLRDLKKQGIAESVARSPRMGFFDLFKNR